MAALIDLTEGEVDLTDRLPRDQLEDWLRLDPGQEPATVTLVYRTAWERVEARIPNRYAPRSFTAVVRADQAGELIELPLLPVELIEVRLFDESSSQLAAQPLLRAGPLPGSFYLPEAGIWNLKGMAGPTPAVVAPSAIVQAVYRLATYAFERRGDFDDHDGFHQSGAADLLRRYVRL